jgi:hypothetical protein
MADLLLKDLRQNEYIDLSDCWIAGNFIYYIVRLAHIMVVLVGYSIFPEPPAEGFGNFSFL